MRFSIAVLGLVFDHFAKSCGPAEYHQVKEERRHLDVACVAVLGRAVAQVPATFHGQPSHVIIHCQLTALQGYLAHKKTLTPEDRHRVLDIGLL